MRHWFIPWVKRLSDACMIQRSVLSSLAKKNPKSPLKNDEVPQLNWTENEYKSTQCPKKCFKDLHKAGTVSQDHKN